MSAEDKIIIKRVRLEGEDLSLIDFRQVASVPMSVIKVSGPMFKKGLQTFITLAEGVEPGDIIQVGDYGIKYKIVKFAKMTVKGRLFRIIRVDGFNITQHDIDGVKVGQKARVVSRRSFTQLFEEAYGDLSDFPEECPPCYPEETGVCDNTPIDGTRRQEEPDIPVVSRYSLFVPAAAFADDLTVTYTDQDGNTGSIGPIPTIKSDQEYLFCADFGSIKWSSTSSPEPSLYIAVNEVCPIVTCSSPTSITLENLGECL